MRDLRVGWNALRRAPGLAAAVIATLGLALGAAIATFSVLNAVLIADLPFPEPDRLVYLRHAQTDMRVACSAPTFLDYRQAVRTLSGLSATRPVDLNLTADGEPERVHALSVSGGFFETLGVSAARGRTIAADDERADRERVLVISHGLWQRRFAGDERAVGAVLRLNGEPYQVVGIMPPGFRWGRGYGTEAAADLWTPLRLTPEETSEASRGNENLDLYGRLAPGMAIGQAQAEMDAVVAGLRARFPRRYTVASGFRVTIVSLREERVGGLRHGLVLVFLSVASLLLAAGANVAGLLLARAAARRRDTSVRLALGASRVRLAREALAEALALSCAAGALGLALAAGLCTLLESIDPAALPRSGPIALSGPVAGFAVLATLVVALASGLGPAWQASRAGLSDSLRAPRSPRGTTHARRILIAGQTAVATALLVGAVLLARSLAELNRVEPGFEAEDVLAARLRLPAASYADRARRAAFVDEVLERLAGASGIHGAAVTSQTPFSGPGNSGTFAIEGSVAPPEAKRPHAELWTASPSYFDVMGIPLARGRAFDARDVAGATPVAVVGETLARRHFEDRDPIGQRIDFEGGLQDRRWRVIVGVVGDVRDQSLDQEPRPQIYVPYAQRPTFGFSVVARASGDPLAALPALRAAVRAADPDLPLFEAAPIAGMVAHSTRDRRAAGFALTGFASAAVLLAGMGLYALLAQGVRERVPEIGLRMALGARPSQVVGLVLLSGGRLVLAGVMAGSALALVATPVLRGLVFGIATTDPATYLAAALGLTLVGLLACSVPAWRAACVDPQAALRTD